MADESQRPMVLMFYTVSLSPASANWTVQLDIEFHPEGTVQEIIDGESAGLTLLLTEDQAWGLARILQAAFKEEP